MGALAAVVIASWLFGPPIAALDPPSLQVQSPRGVNCEVAKSPISILICRNHDLEALDAKLAGDFAATRAQGGVDAKRMDADQKTWLHDVRNRCLSATCVAKAYRARDEEVLTIGAKAASPAAWSETRPFAALAADIAKATALVGHSCSKLDAAGRGGPPIILAGGDILTRTLGSSRFAFLTSITPSGQCIVRDAVPLPSAAVSSSPLQCSMSAMDLAGIGVRMRDRRGGVAFWTIFNARLMRQPVGVLGGDIKCREPETGE